jgi:hypothetical protein
MAARRNAVAFQQHFVREFRVCMLVKVSYKMLINKTPNFKILKEEIYPSFP